MKKLLFAVAAAALVFASCDPKDKGGEGSKLTPDENKAKMEEIAMDITGQINASDFTEFVDAVSYLVDELGMPSTEEDGYEPDPGGSNGTRGAVSGIAKAADPLFIGNLGAIRAIPTAATRVADYAASDLYGIFTWADSDADGVFEWEQEESDSELKFIYPFEGKDVVLSATGSGAETEVTIDGETISVPAKVTVKMTIGTTVLAEMTVDVASIAGDAASGEVNVTVALCGYSFETKTKLTSSNVTASISVKKGETLLVSADVSANVSNLVPTDGDWEGTIGKMTGTVSIMDRAYLKGSSNNFQGFIDGVDELDEEYFSYYDNNGTWVEGKDVDQEYADRMTRLVNNNIHVYMNYDNSDKAIATFEYKEFIETDSWGSYSYGESYLVFASDGSKFTLKEYFNKDDFGGVIDTLEDLAAEFEEMLGFEEQEQESEVHPS